MDFHHEISPPSYPAASIISPSPMHAHANLTFRRLAVTLQEPIAVTPALAILLLMMPTLCGCRSISVPEAVEALRKWGYPYAVNADALGEQLRNIAQEDSGFTYEAEGEIIAPFRAASLVTYVIAQEFQVVPEWAMMGAAFTETGILLGFAQRGVALDAHELRLLMQDASVGIEPDPQTALIAPRPEMGAHAPLQIMVSARKAKHDYRMLSEGDAIRALLASPRSKPILSIRDRIALAFAMANMQSFTPPRSEWGLSPKLHVDEIIHILTGHGFWPNTFRDEIEQLVVAAAHAESAFGVAQNEIRIVDTAAIRQVIRGIIIRPRVQDIVGVPPHLRPDWKAPTFLDVAVARCDVTRIVQVYSAYFQAALCAQHAETRLADYDLLFLAMMLMSFADDESRPKPKYLSIERAARVLLENGFAPRLPGPKLTARLQEAARTDSSFILSDDACWFGVSNVEQTSAAFQEITDSAVIEELFTAAQKAGRAETITQLLQTTPKGGLEPAFGSVLRHAIRIAHIETNGISRADVLMLAFVLKAYMREVVAREVGDGRDADPSHITIEELRYILVVRCRMSPKLKARDILASAGADPRFSLTPNGRMARLLDPATLEAEVSAILTRPAIINTMVRSNPTQRDANRHDPLDKGTQIIFPDGMLRHGTPLIYWRILLSAPYIDTVLTGTEICIIAAVLSVNGMFDETTILGVDDLIAICIEYGFTKHMPYSRFVAWVHDVIRGTAIFDLADDGETILIPGILSFQQALNMMSENDAIREIWGAGGSSRAKSPVHATPKRAHGPVTSKSPSPPVVKPKRVRTAPVKPPELPAPPPFMANTVDFADISEVQLLSMHEGTSISRRRLDRESVRPAHARACAERFALRNGKVELGQVSLATAHYLVIRLGYSVNADAHCEGEALLAMADDGAAPNEALVPTLSSDAVGHGAASVGLTSDMAGWIATRLRATIERAAQGHVRDVFARYAREQVKLLAHFAALATALAPSAADADPCEIARLTSERDDAMIELGKRFHTHVSCARTEFAWVDVPVALVHATLLRRKATRTILLRVPAGANTVDQLRCETCNGIAKSPAACDGELHLLCEICAPSALGRINCPLCG